MHSCQLTEKLVKELDDNHAKVADEYPDKDTNMDFFVAMTAVVLTFLGALLLVKY